MKYYDKNFKETNNKDFKYIILNNNNVIYKKINKEDSCHKCCFNYQDRNCQVLPCTNNMYKRVKVNIQWKEWLNKEYYPIKVIVLGKTSKVFLKTVKGDYIKIKKKIIYKDLVKFFNEFDVSFKMNNDEKGYYCGIYFNGDYYENNMHKTINKVYKDIFKKLFKITNFNKIKEMKRI